MDTGLRLYVLNPDDSVRWQRDFGAVERLIALAAFAEATDCFPGCAVVLCDLGRNRVLCRHDPARDRLPARALAGRSL